MMLHPQTQRLIPSGLVYSDISSKLISCEIYPLSFDVKAESGYMQNYPWIRFHNGVGGPEVSSDFTYNGTTTTTLYQFVDGVYTEAWDDSWRSYRVTLKPGAAAIHVRLYIGGTGSVGLAAVC